MLPLHVTPSLTTAPLLPPQALCAGPSRKPAIRDGAFSELLAALVAATDSLSLDSRSVRIAVVSDPIGWPLYKVGPFGVRMLKPGVGSCLVGLAGWFGKLQMEVPNSSLSNHCRMDRKIALMSTGTPSFPVESVGTPKSRKPVIDVGLLAVCSSCPELNRSPSARDKWDPCDRHSCRLWFDAMQLPESSPSALR